MTKTQGADLVLSPLGGVLLAGSSGVCILFDEAGLQVVGGACNVGWNFTCWGLMVQSDQNLPVEVYSRGVAKSKRR